MLNDIDLGVKGKNVLVVVCLVWVIFLGVGYQVFYFLFFLRMSLWFRIKDDIFFQEWIDMVNEVREGLKEGKKCRNVGVVENLRCLIWEEIEFLDLFCFLFGWEVLCFQLEDEFQMYVVFFQ